MQQNLDIVSKLDGCLPFVWHAFLVWNPLIKHQPWQLRGWFFQHLLPTNDFHTFHVSHWLVLYIKNPQVPKTLFLQLFSEHIIRRFASFRWWARHPNKTLTPETWAAWELLVHYGFVQWTILEWNMCCPSWKLTYPVMWVLPNQK